MIPMDINEIIKLTIIELIPKMTPEAMLTIEVYLNFWLYIVYIFYQKLQYIYL